MKTRRARTRSLKRSPVRRAGGKSSRAATMWGSPVAMMKSIGIVCGGLIAFWTVGSAVAGWTWWQITAPVRAEASVRATSDSLLTLTISAVAGEVANLKHSR